MDLVNFPVGQGTKGWLKWWGWPSAEPQGKRMID